MEIEFVALTVVAQEAIWLKRFLNNLMDEADITSLVLVYYGCQAAISYTKHPMYHSKTKHIEVKFKFAKDMVAHKKVKCQVHF